jgi:hypothetical protein
MNETGKELWSKKQQLSDNIMAMSVKRKTEMSQT